jgi:outer membrane lipoprotein-sorting protein
MIKRTGLVLLLVIIVALLSGCTEMSADQIAQEMKERQDSIKDFSATMVVTTSFGGEEQSTTAKIINKMPDKNRVEYLEPPELAGQVMVSNGKTIWTYTPSKKEVIKMDMPEINRTNEFDYTNLIKDLLKGTDVSYEGTDNFEGRSVYLIRASPKSDSMFMGMRYSMWVDSENWMPLKIEYFDMDDKLVMSLQYQDIIFNTGIPDSDFEFTVPEGVTVVTKEFPSPPREMTLEEVREEVNFTVLTPAYLPEGYVFANATVFKYDDMESVSMRYKKDFEMLMISERVTNNEIPKPEIGDMEKVSINGADGKLITLLGNSKMLVWSIGNIELTMLSGTFSKEEMIKIAESVK